MTLYSMTLNYKLYLGRAFIRLLTGVCHMVINIYYYLCPWWNKSSDINTREVSSSNVIMTIVLHCSSYFLYLLDKNSSWSFMINCVLHCALSNCVYMLWFNAKCVFVWCVFVWKLLRVFSNNRLVGAYYYLDEKVKEMFRNGKDPHHRHLPIKKIQKYLALIYLRIGNDKDPP